MFRLAVLRDDLDYEVRKLGLRPHSGTTEVWRSAKALRHIAVIISEARNIYRGKIDHWLPGSDLDEDAKHMLKEWGHAIDAALTVVKPLRNAFGGHINPEDPAKGQEEKQTHFGRMVRALGRVPVSAVLGLGASGERKHTQMHSITAEYFIFLWPQILDARPGEDPPSHDEVSRRYWEKHQEFHTALRTCLPKIVNTADALLHYFWSSLGIEHVETTHGRRWRRG